MGEYGAGGGDVELVVVVMLLAVVVLDVVVVAAVDMVAVAEEMVVEVVQVLRKTLPSAVVSTLFDNAEFLLMLLVLLCTGKNRRCILLELGPIYRPLSRPR